jgi:putative endonuclease
MNTPPNKRVLAHRYGVNAETLAAWYLRLKGYRIMATRYRNKLGEIDLVALKGQTLVAVEVKARKNFAACEESVTSHKRERIGRAVAGLMAGHGAARRSPSAFAKATARLPAFLKRWVGKEDRAKAGKIAGLANAAEHNIRFDVIWVAPRRLPRHIKDAWRL